MKSCGWSIVLCFHICFHRNLSISFYIPPPPLRLSFSQSAPLTTRVGTGWGLLPPYTALLHAFGVHGIYGIYYALGVSESISHVYAFAALLLPFLYRRSIHHLSSQAMATSIKSVLSKKQVSAFGSLPPLPFSIVPSLFYIYIYIYICV